jgi:predicted phosphatase
MIGVYLVAGTGVVLEKAMDTSRNGSNRYDLVIFDGDGTLWHCLDDEGISLSDKGLGAGSHEYRFERESDRIIRQGDDRQFALFPDTQKVLEALERAEVKLSLASYNYSEPVFDALDAFGIRRYFRHPVAVWTPRKDLMIELILASFANDRRIEAREPDPSSRAVEVIDRSRVLLVDDGDRYASDALRAGIHFFHRRQPDDEKSDNLRNDLLPVIGLTSP